MKQTHRFNFAFAMFASLIIILFISLIANSGYGLSKLPITSNAPASITIPLLILNSTAILLLALSLIAVIFSGLGLSDKNMALGLPQGSVRALIALILIFIFAFLSIYFYTVLRDPPGDPIPASYLGVDSAFLNSLPRDEIVSISSNTVSGENNETIILYDIERLIQPKNSPESAEFANQIITITSTLVTALVSFYFGTRASKTSDTKEDSPLIQITSPDPDRPTFLTKKKDSSLPIRIKTSPSGQSLSWEIEGDKDGALTQVKRGEYLYIRGSSPSDVVILHFNFENDPLISADLRIETPSISIAVPTENPTFIERAVGSTVEINLKIYPEGKTIRYVIMGDDTSTLTRPDSGREDMWIYTRGSGADDTVSITFVLDDYRGVRETLVIETSDEAVG